MNTSSYLAQRYRGRPAPVIRGREMSAPAAVPLYPDCRIFHKKGGRDSEATARGTAGEQARADLGGPAEAARRPGETPPRQVAPDGGTPGRARPGPARPGNPPAPRTRVGRPAGPAARLPG